MQLDEFGALFERSAFRVPARDRYDVDEEREAFARFLKGRSLVSRSTEGLQLSVDLTDESPQRPGTTQLDITLNGTPRSTGRQIAK